MVWEEIMTLLGFFVAHFSTKNIWNIADIGCGNGRLLRHINERDGGSEFLSHSFSYTGLDTSKILLSQAANDTKIQQYSPLWIYGDMRESESLLGHRATFDACFFIASFHHLESYDERLSVLRQAKKLLQAEGMILMTNWNLTHPSQEKYHASEQKVYPDGSADFSIKIGDHNRFYHAFSQTEYESLAQDA